MDAKDIKWIYDLKTGDTVYYKLTDRNIKSIIVKTKVKGVSKKCIYIDNYRIRKDRLQTTSRNFFGELEIVKLINSKDVSLEDSKKAEKLELINRILKDKLLEKLTVEELRAICTK